MAASTSNREKKIEVFNALFASIFNSNNRSWAAWTSDLEDHHWKKNDFSPVVTRFVREQLNQQNVHKSMVSDAVQPRVLIEVADIIAQQFSKGCENLWSPVISDWKLVSIISIYKKGLRKDKENYRHVSLISMPEKIHG